MSKFGKLNLKDLGKGFLIAFLASFLTAVVTVLQTGAFPDLVALGTMASVGLAAGVAYLAKNLLTNSNNQLLAKEPPAA